MNRKPALSSPTLRLALGVTFLALAATVWAPPAHALRVTTWNVTVYPSLSLAARQPQFRTVMASLQTDVLVIQECSTVAGADSFLNVLRAAQPKPWGRIYVNFTESAIYWDSTKVTVPTVTSYNPPSGPRDVLIAVVKPIGYTSLDAQMRVYSIHFKAGGPATVDSTQRRLECGEVRTQINSVLLANVGPNFILGGDTNFYGAYEGGYIRLTESQTNNNGRMKDPLLMPGVWHTNSGYGIYDTQCPCLTCPAGFSGGGMDDRFDLWLSSYSMQDGEGLDLVPGDYIPYGNDGQHYDQDINGGGFNNAVGITVANALHEAADHLPVIITIQLPAKIVAASALNFGTVITGVPSTLDLAVSNPAITPADELTYSFAPPAGFLAPEGIFNVNAGAAAAHHSIDLDTATPGIKAGALVVVTDAPDSLAKPVQLSGTVLAHASASLDSSALATESNVAFLSEWADPVQPPFVDMPVRVYNQGYSALQARLSLDAAVIGGGEGRFSIVGGFSSGLVSGTPRSFDLHFDDTDMTSDSTYTADLTFQSTDEPLPGAMANSDLVVHLAARRVTSGTVVGRGDGLAPSALAFLPPHPNPLAGRTLFAFELPEAATVSLDVYDLSGRRVANLIEGERNAGRHQIEWRATDAAGARIAAGLYFVQLTTPSRSITHRIAVLP